MERVPRTKIECEVNLTYNRTRQVQNVTYCGLIYNHTAQCTIHGTTPKNNFQYKPKNPKEGGTILPPPMLIARLLTPHDSNAKTLYNISLRRVRGMYFLTLINLGSPSNHLSQRHCGASFPRSVRVTCAIRNLPTVLASTISLLQLNSTLIPTSSSQKDGCSSKGDVS